MFLVSLYKFLKNMKKATVISFTFLAIFLGSIATMSTSCAQRNMAKNHCGTKQQKKAKYNSMKRGTSPGGGMLN